MKNFSSFLGSSPLARFSRRALLSAGAAAVLATSNAYSTLTDYTATFSGSVTEVNYWCVSYLFLTTVSAGDSDVIVLSFSADPDALLGALSYETTMTYSVTAGGRSFPVYNGSSELTIRLVQTAYGAEFEFLNSSTDTNTNDTGVFRIHETTTLPLTDVASIFSLADQGTVSAGYFSTFVQTGGAINSNAIGTTSSDGSLGALYSTGQEGGTSYVAATLSPQSFTLSSTPEPSSAALLGAGAAALYLLRHRKDGLVDVLKLARKDSPRL